MAKTTTSAIVPRPVQLVNPVPSQPLASRLSDAVEVAEGADEDLAAADGGGGVAGVLVLAERVFGAPLELRRGFDGVDRWTSGRGRFDDSPLPCLWRACILPANFFPILNRQTCVMKWIGL